MALTETATLLLRPISTTSTGMGKTYIPNPQTSASHFSIDARTHQLGPLATTIPSLLPSNRRRRLLFLPRAPLTTRRPLSTRTMVLGLLPRFPLHRASTASPMFAARPAASLGILQTFARIVNHRPRFMQCQLRLTMLLWPAMTRVLLYSRKLTPPPLMPVRRI